MKNILDKKKFKFNNADNLDCIHYGKLAYIFSTDIYTTTKSITTLFE